MASGVVDDAGKRLHTGARSRGAERGFRGSLYAGMGELPDQRKRSPVATLEWSSGRPMRPAQRWSRRDEMRARALRDHQDGLGDERVRRFKRQVDVVGDDQLTQRLFPRGVAYTVAPRGRAQVDRLAKLVVAIEELAMSPRVAAHVDVEEIKAILDKGKATVTEARDSLGELVDDHEAEALNVTRAVDGFNYLRTDGIARLGAVLGELRAKLGGDSKAAYAYTLPRSEGASAEDEDEDEEEEEEPDAEALTEA